ncbi:MAG: adenylate/guanylate cyclase domain-containing protein [Gammaproteobacteria bacterium]|nr:adenylate/guanylate cyclase domain-containing protein [Gammaproteobacteria bacterium]
MTTSGELSGQKIAAINQSLNKMFASPVFAQSARQRRFLKFIVSETVAGNTARLKGYTIGVEVFDRAPDFDPAIDAIVRVEAARLRGKLREYYEAEGRDDPVRIDLPKGAYAVAIGCAKDGYTQGGHTDPRPADGNPVENNQHHTAPPNVAASETQSVIRTSEDKPSIAVLPFTNMSADPEQEYFADGITEDLITDLSKLSGLFVIARHSAFVYKGVARRVQDIGRELGVRYLLEGSVRRAAACVRINVQLIDAHSGDHLWAERYDRELSEIFALQDEVTHSIVAALELRLTADDHQRLAHVGTDNVEAYELCRRGNAAYVLWTLDALDWAQAFYERSIAIDPSYAEPYAWLARVHTYRWLLGVRSRGESLDVALKLACRAVKLHKELPLAQGVLSWVCNWSGMHNEALRAARLAVTLDPGGAETHYWLGVGLSCSGSTDEAERELARAITFNPHCPVYYLWARAQNYMFMRRYQQAIDAATQVLHKAPTFIGGYNVITASLALADRIDEARRTGAEMNRLFPEYRKHSDATTIGFTKELGNLYSEGFRLAGI